MTPPRPPARPEGAGLLTRLRLLRRDLLSAQPERLYRAKMAHVSTPFGASVLVNEAPLVAEVLLRRPQAFPKSPVIADMLRDLLGRSVFVTDGAEWARARALIDPAFAGGRLRQILPAIDAAARAGVARLAPGGAVEIEAATAHIAADAIFRALFSRPIEDEVAATIFAAFRAYQRSAPLLSPLALIRAPGWLPRLRPGRRHARLIRSLVAGLVAERAAAIAAGGAPDDLATRIMTARDPAGQGFSAAEMLDQVAIFLLAGHETSAAALAWALWLLATHPAAQERVAAEGAALPPRAGLADLDRLGFTRAVLRETLRLYPPVPMLVRETAGRECFRGRALGPGTLVLVSPWHLHRHRALWRDPDGFDPGRWAGPAPARTAYLPFGAGPRLCPGAGFAMAEGVLVLARIAAAFVLSPAEGPPPRPVAQLTVRSGNGIRLVLAPRGGAALSPDRAAPGRD
ncbi:MAG: cytochrome P450 [Paracoccaceae bacterium]|nr:MAG: cytochrome P450 [Alphaproteobacteria bacterium]GIX15078.1 MAG: cytochrome P450 [Paracoccaceae bacterium]